MLPELPARFPRLFLSQFSQEIEIAFAPVNGKLVAIVKMTHFGASVANIIVFPFIYNKNEGEFSVVVDSEHSFEKLPKEIRNAILQAIESFRNDDMVV